MNEFELLRTYGPNLLIDLATAIVCGAAIGIERQRQGSPAGLKTLMLVCVGATTYMFTGHLVLESSGMAGDPTRVAGQIVTGIGFLGAGAIIHGRGGVTGLTSAATIWHTGAIGILIGCHMPITGALITLVSLAAIQILRVLEARLFQAERDG